MHDGSDADSELRLVGAIPATVGLRPMLDVALDVETAAVQAMRAVRPPDAFDPFQRLFLGAEHGRALKQGDAFAVGFSGCLVYGLRLLMGLKVIIPIRFKARFFDGAAAPCSEVPLPSC